MKFLLIKQIKNIYRFLSNLELLSQTLKVYLSKNISKKFRDLNSNYNKIIIDRLL